MKLLNTKRLLILVATAVVLTISSSVLFEPVPYLRTFNFITELVNVLLLGYLFLTINRMEGGIRHHIYHIYLSTGFYLGFIAFSTDALDQFYLHSDLYTAILEKGLELVSYVLIFIGVRLWFEDYQRLNRKLNHQAITDNLTGVYNRRGVAKKLEAIQQKYTGNTSIILMDFDNFKDINDRYGHHIGDMVLQKISQHLLSMKSDRHIPCRWGGEEFLIVAKDHTADEALEVCVAIQSLLNEMDLSKYIAETKITLSYGISEMRAGEHYEECIKRADQALYQSKNSGKNCINVV